MDADCTSGMTLLNIHNLMQVVQLHKEEDTCLYIAVTILSFIMYLSNQALSL